MTPVQLELPFPPPAVSKGDLFKFMYGGSVSDAVRQEIADRVLFHQRRLSERWASLFHEAAVVGHSAAFIILDEVET
jgi:hypothetical protein